MGKFGKILAVFGVLAIGAAVVSKTTKKAKKRRYSSVNTHKAHYTTVNPEKNEEAISDRIKAAATKKVVDILSWAADHEKEIKGASIMLEVTGAAIGVIFAVKKCMKTDKIVKDLNYIKDQAYNDGWNECLSKVLTEIKGSIADGSSFSITLWDYTNKFTVQEVAA